MLTKLVLRLLAGDGQLLGWAAVFARARGDGCLRAEEPVRLVVDAAGVPACLSIHWADLHVETRVPWTGGLVALAQPLDLYEANAVLIMVGTPPDHLPPVTVGRPVSVVLPVGTMGARAEVSRAR